MGFASGSVSFRRFKVNGSVPALPTEAMLNQLEEFTIKPTGPDGIVTESDYGWCGGRHVLDSEFSFGNNVFAESVNMAVRIDTNKVPGDLKKAMTSIEETALAAGNPSGFISKLQKKEARDAVRAKVEEVQKSKKHLKHAMFPVLWDMGRTRIYTAASGARLDKFAELFERTFGASLIPLSAGSMVQSYLEQQGKPTEFDSLRPTRFVDGPEGEGQTPEYPWVARLKSDKDFVGNEFLTWLWFNVNEKSATFHTEQGDVGVVLENRMDLECAYGCTGKDGIRCDSPSTSQEARQAIKIGKLPRKAGMILEFNGDVFTFNFDPELMSVKSCKLPEVQEADTERVAFEERIKLIDNLCQGLNALYKMFLGIRTSDQWIAETAAIREWATK